MRLRSDKNIYWGRNVRDSYPHGTRLRMYEKGHIYFENNLIPSGEILQEWSSEYNYQHARRALELPLLKKGQHYCLKRKMRQSPEESVLLRVVFLDRYHKEIKKITHRGDQISFIYPKDAYTYKIQLLTAGMVSFDFYYLTIEEQEEQWKV